MHVRTRSPIVVLLLCVTVVLAGCGGTSTSAGDTTASPVDTPTPGSSGGAQSSGDGGSSAGDADSTPGDLAWHEFQFDHPVKYSYDTYMKGDGEGTLTWEVTEVDGDEVTVAVDYQTSETSYQSTVSGSKDTVRGQLMMSPAGAFMIVAIFSPTLGYYEGQPLEVGTGWSYTTDEGSASFKITGTDSYGGVDCYVSEMTVDGTLLHKGCFSPDLALAASSVYYDDTGEMTAKLELTSYESN